MAETTMRSILVIDDSLTVRRIVSVCLGRAGYVVLESPDALQALRWLTQPQTPSPALIVLDLMLPTIDGYACLRLLRQRPALAGVPVVLLSSRDGLLDRVKGRLLGAQAYLTKPFQVRQLVAVVRSLLAEQATPEPSSSGCAQGGVADAVSQS